MKKAWLIIMSIFIMILIGGAGTAYYFAKVKTYDVTDTAIEEITETDYEIILPDETMISEGKDDKPVVGSDPTTTKDQENTAAIDPSSPGTGNALKDATKQEDAETTAEDKQEGLPAEQTAEMIIQKYSPSFEHLQAQATGKLDALVAHAYGEYQEKKKNGDSISVPYFYQKYSAASQDLEKNTDQAFMMILGALQKDLKTNGFSTSYADRFKEEYEAQKKAREAALLDKIKGAL